MPTTATILAMLTVVASSAAVTEPPITVEADAERVSPDETSEALTVVPVDDRLAASADLAEVVGNAAGATIQRLGGQGDFAAVSIRGSTLKQVQVYLDGVPLNPDGATIVNLAELPLQAFSRVEVYRGNAPLSFGATPMGGVVNLVTRDSAGHDALAAASGGSYGTGRLQGWVAGDGRLAGLRQDLLVIADGFRSRGDFVYFDDNGTQTDRFDDHLRTRVNNEKTQFNGLARWRAHGAGASLTVMDRVLYRDAGVPGYAVAPALSAGLLTVSNLWVADVVSRRVRSTRGRVWGRWRREVFSDPDNEVGLGQGTSVSQTSNLGVRVQSQALVTQAVLGELVLEVRRDGFTSQVLETGNATGPLARNAATLSTGAVLSMLGGKLEATPALQVPLLDNRNLSDSGASGSSTSTSGEEPAVLWAVNPRLGLLWHPTTNLVIKANAGRYLRPPDPTELFGDRGYIIGNPGLAPEQGWQADVGLRMHHAMDRGLTGRASVTAFWNETEDLILFVQNSQRTMLAVNVGRARVRGVESALSLNVARAVEVNGGLTWTRSLNLSDIPDQHGNELPRTPPWLGFVRATVRWRDTVQLGYLFQYAAANYWDTPNIQRSAPRALHNVYLRCQLPDGQWSLGVSVENVLNRIVEVVPKDNLNPDDPTRVVQAMTDFAGYPLPGRWVTVTVRARF